MRRQPNASRKSLWFTEDLLSETGLRVMGIVYRKDGGEQQYKTVTRP